MDEIPDLPFDPKAPTKTYSELLAEGVPHKGGLEQLASAEQTGGLWSSTADQAGPHALTPEQKAENRLRNAEVIQRVESEPPDPGLDPEELPEKLRTN